MPSDAAVTPRPTTDDDVRMFEGFLSYLDRKDHYICQYSHEDGDYHPTPFSRELFADYLYELANQS